MSATRIELDDLLALRRHAPAVDLSSRRRVLTDLAGPRLSGFRGRGMEFEEHRLYAPGDEVRSIDWRVTARTGKPHVRQYREERERPVILAVDLRPTMQFGTRGCVKSVLAARAAALCGWAAVANGDRVGGLCIAADRHSEVRPASGRRGLLALCHTLVAQQDTDGHPEALNKALQRLLRTTRSGSLVILLSDLRGLTGSAHDLLLRLGRRAELVLGFVHDPLERQLPAPGRYGLRGKGDDAIHTLDTGLPSHRHRWAQQFEVRQGAAQAAALACRAHWLDLPTEHDLLTSMTRGLGRRHLAA